MLLQRVRLTASMQNAKSCMLIINNWRINPFCVQICMNVYPGKKFAESIR